MFLNIFAKSGVKRKWESAKSLYFYTCLVWRFRKAAEIQSSSVIEKDNDMHFTPEDEGNFKHTVDPLESHWAPSLKVDEVLAKADSQRGF